MSDRLTGSWVPADTFGTRLLLIRRELKLTTEEAAARCNLAAPTWNTWENGVTPQKLNEVVEKIHKGLGVNRDYLMWGSTSGYKRDDPAFELIHGTVAPGQQQLTFPPALSAVG